jgi:anti-sigma regulatory factor (Ser/Thr protein kinase)
VGTLVEVVLAPHNYEPAWVTVACTDGPVVVVPLAGARRLDGCLQLACTAADVTGAPGVDGSAGHLTPLRAEQLSAWFTALTAAERPGARAPTANGDGHRRASAAAPGPVPVLLGLGVLSGRNAPVAYPGNGAGPWPRLSTSFRGPPWWQRWQWRWPSVPDSVRAMRLALRPLLDTSALPADDLEDLALAATEAAANAVEHSRRSSQRYFDVLGEVGEHWAGVLIQDHGHWRPADAGVHRGRGPHLMGVLAETTLTVGTGGTTVLLRNHPARSG